MSISAYDRTLLRSGAAASSVSLSEPISNFEYIQFSRGSNLVTIPTNSNWNRMRCNDCSYWSTQGYLDHEMLFKVTNNGSGLQTINFNFFCQEGFGNIQTLGSGVNRANNIKFFNNSIWGIHRISGGRATTGVPLTGAGWTAYNETLLYSASNNGAASFTLSEPATAFSRLKIAVGSNTESRNVYEVNAPSGDGDNTTIRSNWGTGTNVNAFSMSTYSWSDNTTTCSARDGKHFSPDWGALNPYSWAGTASTTLSYIARPIYAMWGINRK